MQRVYRARSYEASAEIFMNRLNIDVWTIESKDNGQEALPHLAKFRESRDKIALGVVSHRDLTADTPLRWPQRSARRWITLPRSS
jgi:methionine synthase II (cobalamin-independent)